MATEELQVRLQCSLRWVAGMLQRSEMSSSHESIPLLLDPYASGGRRFSFTVALTVSNPVIYTVVLSTILPGEKCYDFSTLLHTLARHGVYVVDDDGGAVTHSMLTQTTPLNESSHVAVIEGLMSLYTKSLVTLPRIVNTVRGISKLVASKDLPSGLSEGLLLWMNKVSQSVLDTQRQSHPHREFHILAARSLSVGLCDGQCLGALLVYYAPNYFRWSDFHFGKHPLMEQQASENLTKAINFLNKHLTAPGFHITKEMLLEPQTALHSNLQVLVAHLYHELQVKGLTQSPTTSAVPQQHATITKQVSLKAKLQSRFELVHSNSEASLPLQQVTVFAPPLRQSMARLRSQSIPTHEAITADTLPTGTRTPPRTSLSQFRKARPVGPKPRESWHEEMPQQQSPPSQKSAQLFVDVPDTENVRRSFTVDTTQTLPSAIAAGLPVIESNSEVLLSSGGSDDNDASPECHHSSSPDTTCRVIQLERVVKGCPPISPAPIIENLLTAYKKIKEHHTTAEQDEGALRQRVAQKVLEVVTEPTPPVHKENSKVERVKSLNDFPAFSPITQIDPVSHIIIGGTQEVDQKPANTSHSVPEAKGLTRQLSVTFSQTGVQPQTNPWSHPTVTTTTQDELLRQQREQQVREKLEEREKVRRANQEKRRKAVATQKVLKELNIDKPLTHQSVPEVPPSPTPSDKPPEFLSHNGPGLYVPPRGKSNKKLVRNAISYVCLAGDANLTLKQRALAALESNSANHFMVLFRDIVGFKFRGIYSYTPDSSQVTRIFGSGPKVVDSSMVAHLYKYNSGRKEFRLIPSHTFSVSVDALTIQSEHWAKKNKKHRLK